jgi:hypothetical protein
MEWLDAFSSHALTLPNLAKFAIVLALIVGVSALARRLRIPEPGRAAGRRSPSGAACPRPLGKGIAAAIAGRAFVLRA